MINKIQIDISYQVWSPVCVLIHRWVCALPTLPLPIYIIGFIK